jgi:hypothetical protein
MRRLAIVQRDACVYKASPVNFVSLRWHLLVLARRILAVSIAHVCRHRILRTIASAQMVSQEVNPAAMVDALLFVYAVENVSFPFKLPRFPVRILLVAFCPPVKPYLVRTRAATDAYVQII